MNKSDLKLVIKECVREVLFEDGILSSVIAEVAHGLASAQNLIAESQRKQPLKQENSEKSPLLRETARREQIEETKRKMIGAIGNSSMAGIFEGTEPLPPASGTPQHSPLSGLDSQDSGVDISGILGIAGNAWKKLK